METASVILDILNKMDSVLKHVQILVMTMGLANVCVYKIITKHQMVTVLLETLVLLTVQEMQLENVFVIQDT